MIPINNSDTAWLIVADYNQDNGKFYEDLIEDIISPNVNQWDWEYWDVNTAVGGNSSGRIGGIIKGIGSNGHTVGEHGSVGCRGDVGSSFFNDDVGGNYDPYQQF